MWIPSTIAATSLAAAFLTLAGRNGSDPPEWRAELRSSGGFTGRGVGGLTVQADGTVTLIGSLLLRGQTSESEPACTVTLPDKIKPVADALRASKPETWRERYLPPGSADGCCDQIQWDLEITRTKTGELSTRHRTSWISDRAELPDDLGRLRGSLQDAWTAATVSCSARE
jgi:hypothetical protein